MRKCLFYSFNKEFLYFQEWKNNLQLISIRFDTPGYDEVTKDVAATFTDMLSTVGGTFGLLTGFSLISAVEILYFLARFLMGLSRRNKKNNLD